MLFLFAFIFSSEKTNGQDPLNRSVQMSMEVLDPYAFHFTWEWDWSDGGYIIYKKPAHENGWGDPVAELPWGSEEWTDMDVENGVGYEYAFYKKEFEKIITEVEVPAGEELILTLENLYGNGICCNFGFGWYEAEICGNIVAEGSEFGFIQSDTFTVCDNGNATENFTLTINPNMQVNNTWWYLKDMAGNEIASSGAPGTWLDDRPKYGYIFAGTEVDMIENRGAILLLIDDEYIGPLENEIEQLENDLIGDGWRVVSETANRDDNVEEVKAKITDIYNSEEELNALYILGHIPVPYSGNIYPDGHSENHWGAWATDTYYGDIDGIWTDETVENLSAQLSINHNIPGDGKFDQSAIPTEMELMVGRVDLYDMPAFGNDDVELTRHYLNKAHIWRTGEREVVRRGLVDDNLNIVLASPAASGWRNFAPMFTADSVSALDYFSTMKNESYLFSYGCGGGTHQSADGIGNTADFAADTLKNIFTMLLGSQFGDWDNTDNFLRAPLASPGWTLTNCWAGNPPWTLHRMAMGETIGQATILTQNSTIEDYYPGPQLVHVNLMGDPTLRLHPVKMPFDLEIYTTDNSVELNWSAPQNEEYVGFHIYRKDSLSEEYVRLTDEAVTDTFYSDFMPPDGGYTYMVRTLKLEESGSGTYYNLSLGIWDDISFRFVSNNSEIYADIMEIYPNPAGDYIFIKSEMDLSEIVLELVDEKGRVVTEWELKNESLNVANYSSGIYFLREKAGKGIFEKIIID